MRILYLTEEAISFSEPLVRGGAIHVRSVVTGLRDRGHDVVLVDWNRRPERAFQRSIAPRTRFVDGPVRTLLRAASIARSQPVDVIVSKTRKTYLPGLLAGRLAGVPHVVHVGSFPQTVGTSLGARLAVASASLRLRSPHDGYFVVSESIGDALRNRGVPAERVYEIGNAVDTDAFRPDASPDPPGALPGALDRIDAEFLVGYVGGLSRAKGLSDLATALGRCTASAGALIAGDGPERSALEAEFGNRGAFLGAVSYDAIPAVYHAVDAFVLPSYSEGLPRVLLEAQATATPAIATRVGGVPEVIEDGITGLLCAPGRPGELAAAIDRLAADPGLRAEIGRRGRERVVARYSWDRLFDRYETHLREVVDERRH